MCIGIRKVKCLSQLWNCIFLWKVLAHCSFDLRFWDFLRTTATTTIFIFTLALPLYSLQKICILKMSFSNTMYRNVYTVIKLLLLKLRLVSLRLRFHWQTLISLSIEILFNVELTSAQVNQPCVLHDMKNATKRLVFRQFLFSLMTRVSFTVLMILETEKKSRVASCLETKGGPFLTNWRVLFRLLLFRFHVSSLKIFWKSFTENMLNFVLRVTCDRHISVTPSWLSGATRILGNSEFCFRSFVKEALICHGGTFHDSGF